MKREKICVDNRRNQILEILQNNPQVRVAELAKLLDVSLITIRRDLQYLEECNLLERIHGGAVPVIQPELEEEIDEIHLYRKLIAQYAATLVKNGDTLFINTSSNALQMLQYVNRDNVTVITNNGKAINHEHTPGVNIILTGGELRYPKEAMVGDYAIRNLQTVYAKKSFLGCSGITPVTGMMTEIATEVSINELMVEHTTESVYLLADHTKIGKTSSFISCEAQKIKYLITDEKAPQEILDELGNRGIKIYQVKIPK